ncbi:MAG: DUF2784 domain-containing protein [Geodermatophilaceae bacterium]|nr:DUF2784 domain-containing protein [Geodermatophilaceae bacterium]
MAGLLADAVMIVHFAFLVFLVLGGFLAWRWPRVLIAHFAMASWGLAIVTFEWLCPLTFVENRLRQADGQPELADGFIDTYLTGVIYPDDRITEVRLAVAVIVAVSWIGLVTRWRRNGQRTRHAAPAAN